MQNEESKSGWSQFWRVIGTLNLIFLSLAGMVAWGDDATKGMTLMILGVVNCIVSQFIAFLVDLFTDMRDYLYGMRDYLKESNLALRKLGQAAEQTRADKQ